MDDVWESPIQVTTLTLDDLKLARAYALIALYLSDTMEDPMCEVCGHLITGD